MNVLFCVILFSDRDEDEVNKLTLFSYFAPLTYFPRTIRDWNKLPDSVVLASSIVAGTIWL